MVAGLLRRRDHWAEREVPTGEPISDAMHWWIAVEADDPHETERLG